jgi:hypothetical protein
MSTKMVFAVAAVLAIGTGTAALAQQSEFDRTGDHMYSYGPAMHQGPTGMSRPDRSTPRAPEAARFDPTPDHLYYYGPVSR